MVGVRCPPCAVEAPLLRETHVKLPEEAKPKLKPSNVTGIRIYKYSRTPDTTRTNNIL